MVALGRQGIVPKGREIFLEWWQRSIPRAQWCYTESNFLLLHFFECFYITNLLVITQSNYMVGTQLSIFSLSTLVLPYNKVALTDLVQ